MELHEFSPEFRGLAQAFGKNPTEEMAMEYFKVFAQLNSWQWKELCASSKRELDRFPFIATLYQAARGRKFITNEYDERADPWIGVECRCGGSFVVPMLKVEPGSWEAYRCPMCNTSYTCGYLATKLDSFAVRLYIEPQIEVAG